MKNEKNLSKEVIFLKPQMDIIEPKRAMTEIKTSLDGLTSRVEMTEGRISKPEDRSIELTQSEQQREN